MFESDFVEQVNTEANKQKMAQQQRCCRGAVLDVQIDEYQKQIESYSADILTLTRKRKVVTEEVEKAKRQRKLLDAARISYQEFKNLALSSRQCFWKAIDNTDGSAKCHNCSENHITLLTINGLDGELGPHGWIICDECFDLLEEIVEGWENTQKELENLRVYVDSSELEVARDVFHTFRTVVPSVAPVLSSPSDTK